MVSGHATTWIRDLLAFLHGIPQFNVLCFKVCEHSPHEDAVPVVTERLYELSRRRFDPFAAVEVGSVASADREFLLAARLDVLVWLAPEPLPSGSCADLARFGVFTIQLGDELIRPPYWSEAMNRRPVSTAVIYWHDTSFERARPIRTAETKTLEGWFFTRNAREPLVAVSRMLAAIGLDILTAGSEWKDRAVKLPETARIIQPRASYPSNLQSTGYFARQALRSIRLRMQERGRKFEWFTAIRRRPSLFYSNLGCFSPDELEELPVSPGSEMADPFLFTRNGKTWLYYEDLPPGASNARLSCREIGDAPGVFSKPEIILDKPYHLSYPCVFEHNGEVFMLPETSGDRTVQLYRATHFPYHFEPVANLMEGVALVDTTPLLMDNRWYFFTTTTTPFMETFLFWSEGLDKQWHLHPRSPISSSVMNSRSAGHVFRHGSRLLRPTQDCTVRYGYGMTINEITRLTPTEFEEHRVGFIGPHWRDGLLGTHTLNSTAGFEVIDGLRYQQ